MQEHKDSHRSDSTRLPCHGLHGACRKIAYCKGRDSITINSAVKTEYMQEQCVNLL